MTTKVYFQIGTNNGNDRFRDLVKQNKPSLIILVEPNPHLIPQIEQNYTGIANVVIYNKAIYYENDNDVELVIPSKNGVMGQRADNGIIYKTGHFSLLPMNDWGEKEDMVKINAKTITFDEICKLNNITKIEYLQIDTEGFDSEIIQMIDLTKYTIHAIRFEIWGFDTKDFTRYNNDIAERLGKNGLSQAITKLKNHNYTLTKIRDRDGNDMMATLNV